MGPVGNVTGKATILVKSDRSGISVASERIFGWLGIVFLLAILPIKLLRALHSGGSDAVIGVAPSILGPAGLLFLLLSSTGRVARLSIGQVALLVVATSLTLELVQLLPRPGVLARIHYTFDPIDLFASVISVGVAYVAARLILQRYRGRS